MKSVRIGRQTQHLGGELSFPGDKSLSHRAIIFGSLAEGTSSFTNVLSAEDCVCTRKAFESMGVAIRQDSPTALTIQGKGLHALKAPEHEIYLGNSGTAMRLLLGVLAGNSFQAVLTGDPSLSSRPMKRVTDYLAKMGASFEGRNGANFAPIKVRGGELRGIDANLPIPSAQVKSAILLAGLYAKGKTTVTEPAKSRDHTERFLSYFGSKLEEKGLSVSIAGAQKLEARNFRITGDISSAAFFIGMGLLVPNSRLRFRSVLWNPTRTGIIEVLKRMGAKIEAGSVHEEGPERAADFSITAQSLGAFEIRKDELPSVIDEVPILAVLATQAKGVSIIHDAGELRVKETDRIHSMMTMLSKMWAKIRAEGNTLFIEGPTALHGREVDSFKDHRTAMSLVVAGMVASGETLIRDLDCINTSFPGFFEILRMAGASFQVVDTP